MFLAAASIATAATCAATLVASDDCGCSCADCGRQAPCRKVCRLVCEEKKVEVVCWGCQCEEFCLPGPGCPGCKHCEEVCGDCEAGGDPQKPQAKSKRFVWTEWFPSHAEVHVKKKLMKKVVTKKVPTYKWVVEDLCAQCAAKGAAESGEKTVAMHEEVAAAAR